MSWVQAGGVLAFAMLVLHTLRELRPVLAALREELFEMRLTLAAILERERIRDARRKREESDPGRRLAPPAQNFDDEDTNITSIIERKRQAELARRGERAPRPGTHHDGKV